MRSNSSVIEACLREARFEFIRTSGPGGQNINKVATGVLLRFDVRGSLALDESTKGRLARMAGRRVSSNGTLTIRAERHRTQAGNRADAGLRLVDLLERALVEPRRRVPTKASAAARERRLKAKKQRGEIKRARGRADYD